MSVDTAFKNYRMLGGIMSRLIKLGCKIDAHQHPHQTSLLLDILKMTDKVRIDQLKVAKDYEKTADRLRLSRCILQARESPSTSLSDFYNTIPCTPSDFGYIDVAGISEG